MDYSSDFDNIKREKANAMMKYHRLRKIAKLFRLLEVFVALMLFSWLSTSLPSLLPIVKLYFHKLCVIVVSPKFVFLIGNAIIVTLFFKSGNKSLQRKDETTNLYQEFVKTSENRQKMFAAAETEEEKIVFQDKQTVCEEKIPISNSNSLATVGRDTHTPTPSPRSPRGKQLPRDTPPPSPRGKQLPPASPRSPRDCRPKSYRRSQSENIKEEIGEKPVKELRRSETEKCSSREVEKCGKDAAKKTDGKKEMSNEEFQRRIEAFIAKQGMFHWEESMAIVVQDQKQN